MSDRDPYAELARLAERALALVDGEAAVEPADLEELDGTLARAATLAATVPPTPPPSARPALEAAAATHERLRARLETGLAATAAALKRAGQTQRAARSYGGTPAPTLLDRPA